MRVLLTPFFYVNFADFWIADQLNSLVTAFTDIQYIICFYMTNGSWEKANGKFVFIIIFNNLTQ